MLKGPLACKHHGNLWGGLVAGLDCLVIIHGAACLQNSGNTLFYTDICTITEGKEGIGDHY